MKVNTTIINKQLKKINKEKKENNLKIKKIVKKNLSLKNQKLILNQAQITNKIKKNKQKIIQVKNLVKKYNNLIAVNDINFDVYKGEIFGILGPNGAGKTTTLEIMETILPKTSGKVLIDGMDIDIYPTLIKRIIGIQLQQTGFYPKITLLEMMNLFSSIYNIKLDNKELLKSFNLLEKKDSIVTKLSGGQKQRFAIVLTLISDPKVIFLDEPTTGLDPQARRRIWEIIINLKKKGKTIVLTTHYMDEAQELCDRIAIMDNGKILQTNTAKGYIQELLKRGFEKPQITLKANLEDVFLDLTGKKLRD